MSVVRSVFPYSGGKTKAIKKLTPYLPKDFTEFRDIFTGGGSMSLYVMQYYPEARIWLNDLYYPVYAFWKTVRDNPDELVQWLMKLYIKHEYRLPLLFDFAKSTFGKGSDLEIAGKFYFTQKLGFAGLGANSPTASQDKCQDFSARAIIHLGTDVADLIRSRSVKITNLDYKECLGHSKHAVVFADPPYKIDSALYGDKGQIHRDFDHGDFSVKLQRCKTKWLLTYNDVSIIRWYFRNSFQTPLDFAYSMSGRHQRKTGMELIISNYDLFDDQNLSVSLTA